LFTFKILLGVNGFKDLLVFLFNNIFSDKKILQIILS